MYPRLLCPKPMALVRSLGSGHGHLNPLHTNLCRDLPLPPYLAVPLFPTSTGQPHTPLLCVPFCAQLTVLPAYPFTNSAQHMARFARCRGQLSNRLINKTLSVGMDHIVCPPPCVSSALCMCRFVCLNNYPFFYEICVLKRWRPSLWDWVGPHTLDISRLLPWP